QVRDEAVHALGEERGGGGEVERRATVGEQPAGAALGELARLQQHGDLGGGGHLVVQLLDRPPEARQVEDLTGDEVGAGDVGRGRAGLLPEPEQERRAAGVDEVVHHAGGDDLPAQRVAVHVVAHPFPQRGGEVRHQPGGQVGVVGQVRG